MTLQTFTPAANPSYELPKTTKTKILRAEFGDGYSQRVGDGLNHIRREVTLTFNGLTTSQADAIETFFEARGGAEAFYYTLPRESSPRKWITTDEGWTRTPQGPTLDSLTVKLQEVFDLV